MSKIKKSKKVQFLTLSFAFALTGLALTGCEGQSNPPTFDFAKSPCADPDQYPFPVAIVAGSVRQQFLKSDGSGQYDLPALLQAVCSRDPRVFSPGWLGSWSPSASVPYGSAPNSYPSETIDFTTAAQSVSSGVVDVDFDWVALTDNVPAPAPNGTMAGSLSTEDFSNSSYNSSYLLPAPNSEGSTSDQYTSAQPHSGAKGIATNFNGDPVLNESCRENAGVAFLGYDTPGGPPNQPMYFCYLYAAGQGQRIHFNFPLARQGGDAGVTPEILTSANWDLNLSFAEQAVGQGHKGGESCTSQPPDSGFLSPAPTCVYTQEPNSYMTTGWTATIQGHYTIPASCTAQTAPVITTQMPANGATGVQIKSPVTLQFSQAMSPFVFGNITLSSSGGTPVPTTVTIATTTCPWDTVTLTPQTSLVGKEKYTINFPSGLITAFEGGAALQATSSSFTTE